MRDVLDKSSAFDSMIEMNPERMAEVSGEGEANIDKAKKLIDEVEFLSLDEISLHIEEMSAMVALLSPEDESAEVRQSRAKLSQLIEKARRQ